MRQRNVLLLLCLGLLSTLKVHAQSRATARVYEDIIHTYAGGGPDGIPALSANLPVPTAVATDSAGNIYIAAPGGNRVFAVDGSGKIRVVAGSGVEAFNGNDGPTKNASLNIGVNNLPNGIAVDAKGNIFFVDKFNNQIRSVDTTTGIITTFAGSGPGGYYSGGYSGDGGPATSARLNLPGEIAFDSNGNLFIADSQNGRIRRVDASTGIITTVAAKSGFTFRGDGGLATAASFNHPAGVALDTNGNLFIADAYNCRVRRVDASSGIITTVAGNGEFSFSGDGGPAIAASLWLPIGVRVDTDGNLFIADLYNHRVRRVDASTGIITTFAGSGQSGVSGDGGLATSVDISPVGVAIESSGNLLIADADSKRVRRVNLSTNIVATVAGNGEFCFYGDGGPALAASLCAPQGLTADPSGNLLAYDSNNGRVRRINAETGQITTVAGGGNPADGLGDNAPAAQATFSGSGLAADARGNMFITDWSNFRVRRVDAATGIITTVAGSGGRGGNSGDGGPATLATLAQPQDVVLDRPANLFISTGALIRRVDAATGVITTFAGNGVQAFTGDGGPASNASLGSPAGMYCARDGSGRIFISDTGSNRIRVIARRAP